MAAGKVHLELLELYRRLYLKARALSLAQVCLMRHAVCSSGGSRRTLQKQRGVDAGLASSYYSTSAL